MLINVWMGSLEITKVYTLVCASWSVHRPFKFCFLLPFFSARSAIFFQSQRKRIGSRKRRENSAIILDISIYSLNRNKTCVVGTEGLLAMHLLCMFTHVNGTYMCLSLCTQDKSKANQVICITKIVVFYQAFRRTKPMKMRYCVMYKCAFSCV